MRVPQPNAGEFGNAQASNGPFSFNNFLKPLCLEMPRARASCRGRLPPSPQAGKHPLRHQVNSKALRTLPVRLPNGHANHLEVAAA